MLFKKQTSLPIKLRFKSNEIFEITSLFIQSIQPIIQRLVTRDIRQILIKHNFIRIGIIHGFFILNQINEIKDPIYLSNCNQLYGPTYINQVFTIINRIEPNKTLIKILISILIFSTNLSIVTFPDQNDIKTRIISTYLIKFENLYLNVLWKYMIYQYGYIESIRRFDGMIKNILDIYQARKYLIKIKIHDELFNEILYSFLYFE